MRMLIAAAAAATLAGCGPTRADIADQRALAEARAIGAPVECIALSSIRNTRVRDEQTIDFYTNGRRVFRNTLPESCPLLGFERRFTYKTSTSQLCSIDVVNVITTTGRGPTCRLGMFQPIETRFR